jgi:hypothetical protein
LAGRETATQKKRTKKMASQVADAEDKQPWTEEEKLVLMKSIRTGVFVVSMSIGKFAQFRKERGGPDRG